MIIPENSLVILVGVAGSGKSTLAKRAFGDDIDIGEREMKRERNCDDR